jgi:two-component system response regulator
VDVLLVEDDSNDAEMTVWALEKNQLMGRVHRVRDGAEAIDYLFGKDKSPDLARLKVVLLDIKLPKLDGLEVLRKMKADAALRHIPVVILTSSNETRDRQAGYSLGVNSYVVKPVDFDQFVEAIGQVGKYWLNINRPSA